jgi:mono/diheme cytochrome c family protein
VRRALRQRDAQSLPAAKRTAAGSGCRRRWLWPALALALSIVAHAGDPTDCAVTLGDDSGLATAWQTLRIIDCARCHGRHYTGLAAPSIVDYVRTQSREQFDHIVLVGDPPRGMPGYRSNRLIAETIDDLYRYFLGRAEGSLCADARPPSKTWSAGAGGAPARPTVVGTSRSGSSVSSR